MTTASTDIILESRRYDDLSRLAADIRRTFYLDVAPFDDIQDTLLILAFCPNQHHIPPSLVKLLADKHGISNHAALEYYGDMVWNIIVVDIVSDLYGLSGNPLTGPQGHIHGNNSTFRLTKKSGVNTMFKSYLSSNRLMVDIMKAKGACEYIRGPYVALFKDGVFKKGCADVFEALVGVVYIHLKTKGLDIVTTLRQWTDTALDLMHWAYAFEETGSRWTYVRPPTSLYTRQLGNLFGADNNVLFDISLPVEDRPRQAILMKLSDVATDVSTVFAAYAWSGPACVYDQDLNIYAGYVYPYGVPVFVGYTVREDECLLLVQDWLIYNGYLCPYVPPQRYFSDKFKAGTKYRDVHGTEDTHT